MKKPTTVLTPQPPWEALSALLVAANIAPVRPPDTFTVEEYADHAGIARVTANERLRRLLKAGHLERLRIRSATGQGLKYCYRVKPPEEKGHPAK